MNKQKNSRTERMFGGSVTGKDTQQSQNSYDIINKLSFCVFDLETTGGNQKMDKIIEIGLVKVENLEIVDQRNYLIQPEINIPDFIQKLTTIRPEDVKSCPKIEDVIEEILEFMGDSILVAHNTSFDVPFFNSVLKRLGRPIMKNKSLCTNLMTKNLIPNLMNSNLNYMSKIFNIKHKKAHRAQDDAVATAHLLIRYLKIFIHKDIKKINHLYYPKNKYELDRANFTNSGSLEQIKKTLKLLKASSLITLKGHNGLIHFAYPFSPQQKDRSFLLKKIETIKWNTMTIKLVGSFVDTLINYNHLFSKLEANEKATIIENLWETHLPQSSPQITPIQEQSYKQVSNSLGDFIILHHLVPEQLIVYPIVAMHPKLALVFRYPSHQKKLLQYLQSKISRLKNNRLKKSLYHPQLKKFLEAYIKEEYQTGGLFSFKKNELSKSQEKFFKRFEEYLSDHQNPYNYPKEYI